MDSSPAQLESTFSLPDEIPVMDLSDCVLFPGCQLPLYIFEERFRQMLQHALDGSRMMCVGTRTADPELPVLPWSTAAVISACVRQPDGTSHVMLQGLQRIHLRSWVQEKPFRIARIEPIEPQLSVTGDELEVLRAAACSMLPTPTPKCAELMNALHELLDTTACADRVCDILSYHFVRQPGPLVTLMAEPDLAKRYRILIKQLRLLQDNKVGG
jgi:ATP-dependent Lon protease